MQTSGIGLHLESLVFLGGSCKPAPVALLAPDSHKLSFIARSTRSSSCAIPEMESRRFCVAADSEGCTSIYSARSAEARHRLLSPDDVVDTLLATATITYLRV